ncbi:hypothetical protein FGB62_31g18 [Gracilaria domingensis]|nr:hypothetical protein FGB62_31g18 [Gracilaria domingensis]
MSALFFITLELFVSFFTDPARVTERQRLSCVSVDNMRNLRGPAFEFTTVNNLIRQCSFFEKEIFHQRGGNVTETENGVLVQCAEEDIFSFNISEKVSPRTFPSIKPIIGCSDCSEIEEGRRCKKWCAFVVRQNNSVFHSFAVEPEEALAWDSSGDAQQLLSYIGTTVHFNATDQLGEIAQRMAYAYTDTISDTISQRRRIFMGSIDRTCEFLIERGEGTNVPMALIVSVSSVWFFSLVLKLFSFSARRQNTFDVSSPFDWAFRTFQKSDVIVESNPVIRWDNKMNKERPFFVSEAVR